VARELFQSKPDWVTFFRETLGVNGAARNVFSRQEEYVAFEKSREYAEIQNMVLALRNRKIPANTGAEATRVITVRLPESLHEALKAEANDHNTSMNKLCISKLLQVLIDSGPRQVNRPPQIRPMPAPQNRAPSVPAPAAGSQQPVPRPQPIGQPAPVFRPSFGQPAASSQSIPPRAFGGQQ
jgi:predicted HicB family RNase H-like nuclease